MLALHVARRTAQHSTGCILLPALPVPMRCGADAVWRRLDVVLYMCWARGCSQAGKPALVGCMPGVLREGERCGRGAHAPPWQHDRLHACLQPDDPVLGAPFPPTHTPLGGDW